jgi:hypothetical protein
VKYSSAMQTKDQKQYQLPHTQLHVPKRKADHQQVPIQIQEMNMEQALKDGACGQKKKPLSPHKQHQHQLQAKDGVAVAHDVNKRQNLLKNNTP